MASADDVKNITGYTIGGVSPIGHLNKLIFL
jgi:prolyl-tRNA editing enzyme YbaK/EbsC (Cys-tRNA(Pro) deacylase)